MKATERFNYIVISLIITKNMVFSSLYRVYLYLCSEPKYRYTNHHPPTNVNNVQRKKITTSVEEQKKKSSVFIIRYKCRRTSMEDEGGSRSSEYELDMEKKLLQISHKTIFTLCTVMRASTNTQTLNIIFSKVLPILHRNDGCFIQTQLQANAFNITDYFRLKRISFDFGVPKPFTKNIIIITTAASCSKR